MKKRVSYTILPLLALIFSACATDEEKINFETRPKLQVPKQAQEVNKRKGSIYTRKGASLFADKKDLQVGDIIQVNIDEELKSDSKNSRDMSKSNTTDLGGGLMTPMTGVTNPRFDGHINNFNNTFGVGFGTESTNNFKGSATSKFDESFTTTISAIIEQTYQNGNYYIKGSKEIMIDGQLQQIMIAGVIRPYDITPENSVNSSQVANLKIIYKKEGVEGDSLDKSWGSKAIETIWPF
jgi:flagellar L-ring protein precursor FlgH